MKKLLVLFTLSALLLIAGCSFNNVSYSQESLAKADIPSELEKCLEGGNSEKAVCGAGPRYLKSEDKTFLLYTASSSTTCANFYVESVEMVDGEAEIEIEQDKGEDSACFQSVTQHDRIFTFEGSFDIKSVNGVEPE